MTSCEEMRIGSI